MYKTVVLLLLVFAIVSCSGNNEEKKTAAFEKKVTASKESKITKSEENIPVSVGERGDYNISSIKVTANVYRKKSKKLYWDNDQKPDIYGLIEFPNGDALAFPLKRNSFTNTAIGENMTLNKGDSIHVILRDKDISGYDEIANGKFAYNGRTRFTKKIGKANFTFVIKKRKKK